MMTTEEMNWDRLHDAVLREVSIMWGNDHVMISIAPNDRYMKDVSSFIIFGFDFTSVRCPKENPWGPSDFIDGATHDTNEDGPETLKIKMQSGDVIEIQARTFQLVM